MQEDDSKTIEKRISENTKVIFRNSTNVKFQQLKNAISKDKLRPHLSGVFLDLRNEIIVDKNVLIDDDVFDFIISRNAKSVFVHKINY